MGLAETQKVLAQLYTNSELRERFFANSDIVGMELGLSLDEAQQLAQISAKDVNIFANSLKWKRLGEVRELLPRTGRVLGKDFNALFWRYAETYLPQGAKKHQDDAIPSVSVAIAFANFIINIAQLQDPYPAWLRDLVRYEKTWLLANQSHRYLQICWFGYAIHLDCTAKPTIAILWRFSTISPLQHFVMSLPPLISNIKH